jgi:hypothetical protein
VSGVMVVCEGQEHTLYQNAACGCPLFSMYNVPLCVMTPTSLKVSGTSRSHNAIEAGFLSTGLLLCSSLCPPPPCPARIHRPEAPQQRAVRGGGVTHHHGQQADWWVGDRAP